MTSKQIRVATYDCRAPESDPDKVAEVDVVESLRACGERYEKALVASGEADVVFVHLGKEVKEGLRAGRLGRAGDPFPATRDQVFIVLSKNQGALAEAHHAVDIEVDGTKREVLVPTRKDLLQDTAVFRDLVSLSADVGVQIRLGNADAVPQALWPLFGLVKIPVWMIALRVLCEDESRKLSPSDKSVSSSDLLAVLQVPSAEGWLGAEWELIRKYCAHYPELSDAPGSIENLLEQIFERKVVELGVLEEALDGLERLCRRAEGTFKVQSRKAER